jgi:hypothetical protein
MAEARRENTLIREERAKLKKLHLGARSENTIIRAPAKWHVFAPRPHNFNLVIIDFSLDWARDENTLISEGARRSYIYFTSPRGPANYHVFVPQPRHFIS